MTTKKSTAPAKKQGTKKRTAPNTMTPARARYYKERQAKTEAEWKKARAEGRVDELAKYDPKTGRSVWRKAKA